MFWDFHGKCVGAFGYFDQQMMPKLCQHVLKFGFDNFLNPANQHPEPSLFPPRRPPATSLALSLCHRTVPGVFGLS